MSILHRRGKIRDRAVARNKGECRELPIEAPPASSKKRKPQPIEHERASVRADRVEAERLAAEQKAAGAGA